MVMLFFFQCILSFANLFVAYLDPAWSLPSSEMAMEERARSCLLRFRHKLEEDIKPAYLMDHMISDGVLTVDEEEKIRTQVSFPSFSLSQYGTC